MELQSNRGWILLPVILVILGIAGCATGKKAADAEIKTPAKAKVLIASLSEHHTPYTWFSGKARVRIETDDLRAGGTITLRMLQDSLIWARVEKLGFEIGRALITPDSAFIVDRLNKEYYAKSLQDFTAEYNAPFTFEDLQQVLAGGPLPVAPGRSFSRKDKSFHLLVIENSHLTGSYWFERDLTLQRSMVADHNGRSIGVIYADYRATAKHRDMPYGLYLELYDGDERTELTFNYSRIELDVPKSTPFSIPHHYARTD